MGRLDESSLMQGRVSYDPVKAHEYYIRTRELKGRKKGQKLSVSRSTTRQPTYLVKSRSGHTVRLTGQQLAEQKAYAAKRVGDIKHRLTELTTRLHKLRSEAQTKDAKSKRQAKKPVTAAEKHKAAKESKQYREKHKQSLSTKRKTKKAAKPSRKQTHVAELETKINQIKSLLTTAVAKQRALASATRNR